LEYYKFKEIQKLIKLPFNKFVLFLLIAVLICVGAYLGYKVYLYREIKRVDALARTAFSVKNKFQNSFPEYLDGVSKKQMVLYKSLEKSLKTGNENFAAEKYKLAEKNYQEVLLDGDKINGIEKNYCKWMEKGNSDLAENHGSNAVVSFTEMLKYKQTNNAKKLLVDAENMTEFQNYVANGAQDLKNHDWVAAVKAFNSALTIPGYNNSFEAKNGLQTAENEIEFAKQKKLAAAYLKSTEEYITSSSFYKLKKVGRNKNSSVLNYCNKSLDKIAYLEKKYTKYLASDQKIKMDELKSSIDGLKSLITILPSDLKKVDSASYPSVQDLAAGSEKAQNDQKELSENSLLPVEVETLKYGVRMRLIPTGSFKMGSPLSEKGRDCDEGPQHVVTIDKPFYIGMFEITQRQWKDVMGTSPAYFKAAGEFAPVEEVSWDDCQLFLEKLCAELKVPNGTYRLPTEAEWEYTCRAGTKTSLYNGELKILSENNATKLNNIAWYRGNSEVSHFGGVNLSGYIYEEADAPKFGTHPVGLKEANAFGLYDTIGNVWEWCSSRYKYYKSAKTKGSTDSLTGGAGPVFRGGSWEFGARFCRAAFRNALSSDSKSYNIGLRIIRVMK
jgi:formylglycine-generating enzyme required for sulfatase activity